MPKYRQTQQELLDHLREQLHFLGTSAASFDRGFEGEAKRLAATVRVLVHDTKKSKSLLHLLGLKQAIRMYNTADPFDSRNLAPHQGLLIMRMEVPGGTSGSITFPLWGEGQPSTDATPDSDKPRAKMTYLARVQAPANFDDHTEVPFTAWWDETVIRDRQGNIFTRKDIILAMANKEGGAHVDPELDEAYAKLTRFHSQGWQFRADGIRQPPENSLVAASVRQIAHEVAQSVAQSFPELCP